MINEAYLFYATLLGLALLVVGWLGLVVLAFRTSWVWGLGVLLIPPLAVVFAVRRGSRGAGWLICLILGMLLAVGPPLLNRMLPIDLGPYESIVEGERHLTLTGWDRKRYDFLANERDLVVLQMANADVDDATLDLLKNLTQLRELDLSNTAISDAGLTRLSGLPGLQRLRLKNTRITDAGFREHLSTMESLRELDLSGTAVSAETVTAWRKAKPGRRALR